MNASILRKALYGLAATVILLQSCDDKEETPPPPAPITGQSFTQSFDDMNAAKAQGWIFKNRSDDAGNGFRVRTSTIFYGDAPYDGTGLLYSNYAASTTFDGNISDWAISPARIFQNGDKISFYALSNGSNDGYADRLQLRLNVFNSSDSIGLESTDIGGFNKPLIDINPIYRIAGPGDFPTTWTKYEATVTGLNKPDSGRFAIRYFVEIHGGANGDEVAVDKVEFKSVTP
jgi:hypothetical protein